MPKENQQISPVRLVVAVIVGLLLANLSVATSAKAAAGDCKPALPERNLVIATSKVEGFGTLQKFEPLPLAAGEYVLTFDDGPVAATTPGILETLRADCLHATFFMVGRNAEKNPELARAVLEQGHSVGSHSYSHRNLATLPHADGLEEIEKGNAAVEKAIYGEPRSKAGRLFRFPNNVGTPELISDARRLGMTIASYDISPADWRGNPPEQTLERLRMYLKSRDRGVIVLHDAQPNTVPLLPMVIADLRTRHATIVHIVAE